MTQFNNKYIDVLLNIILIVLSLMCILPLFLVLSVSLTSEYGITTVGYRFIPSEFSVESYRFLWEMKDEIINAYGVTIFSTVVGTLISVLTMLLFAYPLSRNDFKFKKPFAFFSFFTMLFNGGLVSWYMICTKVLGLSNSIWALILPYTVNAWFIIILRTFLKMSVPQALLEAAKIDGAGEFRILFQIVIPIAVPGIATIALFQTLNYWNDWWLPLNFVTKSELYNLQFYLQNVMAKVEETVTNAQMGNVSYAVNVPSEGVRMAMCIVVMGPILVVYPFFQKYFIQGLTIGSVKG